MHAPQISRESHPKSEHPSVTQPTSQPFIHSEQANLCVLCQKRWVESSASILSLLSIVPTQPITVSLFEPRLWRERKGREGTGKRGSQSAAVCIRCTAGKREGYQGEWESSQPNPTTRMELEANDRCGMSSRSSSSHRSGIPFPVCAFIPFSSLSLPPFYPLRKGEGGKRRSSTKVLGKRRKKQYLLFCIPAMLKCAESTKFLGLKPESAVKGG